ncbi:hypothetical protein [Spirosoma validum]|nr:hypothetical protein [Spirosoma validum]
MVITDYCFRKGATLAQTAGKFTRNTGWGALGIMLSWLFGII